MTEYSKPVLVMRILYLTEFLSSIGGGGEAAFYDFCLEMSRKGHQINIICHQSDEDCVIDREDSEHLRIHRIKPLVNLGHGRFPATLQQIQYVMNLVKEGSKVIHKHKIDVIHANTISPAFAGAILGTLFKLPVVNTVHHVYSIKILEYLLKSQERHRTIFRISRLPKLLCEKLMVKLPYEMIHTVSNSSKHDLLNFGVESDSKVVVIPNGINPKNFDCTNVVYDDLVVFIGRLVEYKNLDVVISAFKSVRNARPNARLAVIGDGPMRRIWEEIACSLDLQDNIEFLGYISEERKLAILRSCSMLVLPSLVEGFGLVILEAYAMKKPVLVSDVMPFQEIVENNVDGFVVPAASPSDWAEKIILLLEDKSICKAMGTAGRRKVEATFNISSLAAELESMYHDVIDTRHPILDELQSRPLKAS